MSTIRRRETGFFMGDNAIFDRHDLSVYEKIVYLYLCRRADSESRAWPSYARIAQDCGISRDTAIRAVAKLVEKGLLEKNVRKDPNGNMTSNEYILLPVFSPQNPDPRKRDCDNNHGNGNGYEQPGVVAHSDQVVADSHRGSRSQQLPLVADSDPKNTHIEEYPYINQSFIHQSKDNLTKIEGPAVSSSHDGMSDDGMTNEEKTEAVMRTVEYAKEKLADLVTEENIMKLHEKWVYWITHFGEEKVKYAIDRLAEQERVTNIARWMEGPLKHPEKYPPKVSFRKKVEQTPQQKAEQKKKTLLRSMYS